MVNLVFSQGQIWDESASGPLRLTAKEVHSLKKSSDNQLLNGLDILSYGTLKIILELVADSKPRADLRCEAHSDGVKIDVNLSASLAVDYFANAKHLIPVRFHQPDAIENSLRPLIEEIPSMELEVAAAAALRISEEHNLELSFSHELLEELSRPQLIQRGSPTDTTLWPYQAYGFSWLYRLWECRLGGILGDEMGVGKTLQLIALSCQVARSGVGPVLIVVPSGLLLKWCKDFVDHATSFVENVHVHYGPGRSKSVRLLSNKQIVLTTYSLVVQDFSMMQEVEFAAIACDEAHELKESRTMKSQAIKGLNARAKFLATGTPIQNNLTDYWTLIDIVDPGLLGPRHEFESKCQNTPTEAARLVEQTKHKILRRTQEQVGIEIPEGTEFYVPLELSGELREEYRQLALDSHGVSSRGTLQRRRQFCAHPAAFDKAGNARLGAKSDYLLSELEKISDLGEKVVIFVADFNEPRDLYRKLINEELPVFWTGTIDGRTPNDFRHVLLQQFSDHVGPAALLINPLVGGQGLDIVAANHVFHMNPAWNPAKIDQATFRVTRPGQTRETWSHHLYYASTVEESIHDLVMNKRELSEAALQVAEAEAEKASKSIFSLFQN
jgi:SNF2 family DNA or RNA helicase